MIHTLYLRERTQCLSSEAMTAGMGDSSQENPPSRYETGEQRKASKQIWDGMYDVEKDLRERQV